MSNPNANFIISDVFEPDNLQYGEEILDFDSLLPVESITTAERIQKYPEMYHFRPLRRSRKLPGFPEPSPPPATMKIGKMEVVEEEEAIRDSNVAEQVEIMTEPEKIVNSSICPECGHWFRSRIILNTHRKFHAEKADDKIRPLGFKCPIPKCKVQCDSQGTLNEHVRMHHQREELVYETMQFANWVDFERWKDNLEYTTNSRFVLTSGRYTNTGKTSRFSCYFARNSSSLTRCPRPPTTIRQRSSRKLNTACTAFLSIKEVYGQVHLRGCLTHCGHDDQLQNLPLSITVKREIASDLVRGMSEEQILRNFRESYPSTDRRFYIRPYEVRNIYHKLMRNQDTMEESEHVENMRKTKRRRVQRITVDEEEEVEVDVVDMDVEVVGEEATVEEEVVVKKEIKNEIN
uniref:C2H2-type domain-containing protein n=1 Tax=Caenorhabditis tropicalis TaxID=1561998 RepID=A0A1I7UWV4_9PELO